MRGTGRSTALIYVDIVGAFDAVLRQLVFGSNQLPFDDAGIAHIVHALGLPPSVMHHIASELSSQCILRRMDVPAVLSRSVAEAHAHTWFSTQGLGAVAQPRAGSRPGDPLGDVIFNILECHVHSRIEAVVKDHPAILVLPPLVPNRIPPFLDNDPAPVFFNNYVDDDAFAVTSPSAELLVQHVAEMAAIICRTFLCLGLALNYKENKTEIVVNLVGPNSRRVLRDLITDCASSITVPAASLVDGVSDIKIKVVAWYKHMGVATAASRSLPLEAKARAGALFSTLRSIRPKVIKNPRLDVHTKLSLCASLLFSRLFFASALWHHEPEAAKITITNAYITPLREALSMTNVDYEGRLLDERTRTTNVQVLIAAEVPSAIGRARLARIKYWVRFVRAAPRTLLRLYLACHDLEGTWSSDLADDLRACWQGGAKALDGLPDPRTDIVPWLVAAHDRAPGFIAALCLGVSKHYAPSASGERAEEREPCVACPECDKMFPSFVVMCSHRTAKHGYINPLRRHVCGTQCPSCHVQFHSYARLYHHTRNKRVCRDFCFRHVPPMSMEVAKAIMAASLKTEQARKSKDLRCPCIRP